MELYLHNRPIKTVFGLLGEKENDITFSLGWALSRCDEFAQQFLKSVFPKSGTHSCKTVRLQEGSKHGGFTDIEIQGEESLCIIEAKKGWSLPKERQLKTYVRRFAGRHQQKLLVVLSECSADYAKLYLPPSIKGIPVVHRSWKEVEQIVSNSLKSSLRANKQLLFDLKTYLRNLMNMQNHQSNLVFVVALSTKKPYWATASTADILKNNHKYFHPFGGGGWPLIPPNYLGFTYNEKLQSIHHVEKYNIATWTNLHKHIPEIRQHKWERDYIVYSLGPAIKPQCEVRTETNIRRVWAALDLLLTCKTISQAQDRTLKRPGNI